MRARRVGSAVAAVVIAVVVAGCGGDDGTDEGAVDDSTGGVASADAPSADDAATTGPAPTEDDTVAADDEPPPAPPSEETCGDPATPLAFGETVSGTFEGSGSVYYCVEVPAGQSLVEVSLTDLTADLDLWVAHDTFDELSGGFALKFSDGNGTSDEVVTYEPSLYRGELIGFDTYADVTPGPYWIELTGMGDESTYSLTVAGTAG